MVKGKRVKKVSAAQVVKPLDVPEIQVEEGVAEVVVEPGVEALVERVAKTVAKEIVETVVEPVQEDQEVVLIAEEAQLQESVILAASESSLEPNATTTIESANSVSSLAGDDVQIVEPKAIETVELAAGPVSLQSKERLMLDLSQVKSDAELVALLIREIKQLTAD